MGCNPSLSLSLSQPFRVPPPSRAARVLPRLERTERTPVVAIGRPPFGETALHYGRRSVCRRLVSRRLPGAIDCAVGARTMQRGTVRPGDAKQTDLLGEKAGRPRRRGGVVYCTRACYRKKQVNRRIVLERSRGNTHPSGYGKEGITNQSL